jgi:NAD(P)-dependent dehydrogenase (short-subunit alcohol dehydrogenase family)
MQPDWGRKLGGSRAARTTDHRLELHEDTNLEHLRTAFDTERYTRGVMDYKTLFDLSGKTALVVGAASGIGRASALGLADFGAHVVVADLNLEGARTVAGEIQTRGGTAEAASVNLGESDSVNALLNSLEKIDVLVCTPAVNVRKRLLEYTDEEFDRVVNLNLKGNFRLLQGGGRKMAASGGGSIIVFSSIRSVVVEPGQGVYAATKAGVLQLVRTLAAELAEFGVRANAIGPGVVNTPLTQPIKNNPEWYNAYAARSALGRWAEADEMVGPVIYLASAASSYVTGTIHFVDGGWTAIDGRFTPPL